MLVVADFKFWYRISGANMGKQTIGYKSVDDVTYRNEFEALLVLEQLVDKIILEDFKGDQKLKEYMRKRFKGAKEVLRRRASDYYTESELRSVVPSSKALEEGMPKEIKVRGLDLEEKVVKVGADEDEAFHHVMVSRSRFKCTCQDAIMLASTADKRLKTALQAIGVDRIDFATPVFYRYVLCKHTLAKIAKSMVHPSEGIGILNIDKELMNTLRLGLFAVYMRVSSSYDPEVVKKMYDILRLRVDRDDH